MNEIENIRNKILVREFNERRDIEAVKKLEKNCSIGSKKGISMFTNMMNDPLCRIRLYPVHVMLVAEMLKNGKLVGMVRGCIKLVGTGFGGRQVRLGCILGLRVSPRSRRMRIGLQLVQSIEEWLMRNGAQYFFLATEEKNIASTNLFTIRCSYVQFSSLVIYIQPVISSHAEDLSDQDIKIEKLSVDQAISFYKNNLKCKNVYPADIDAIFKESLSLGTWMSYIKEGSSNGFSNNNSNSIHETPEMYAVLPSHVEILFSRLEGLSTNKDDTKNRTPSSWAIFSIWNTCEAYKLQVRRSSHPLKAFHGKFDHARSKIFPCLKLPPISDSSSIEKPFGFLFLYGLHGEGERVGELMKSVWSFASRLAKNVRDCKAIVTELGLSDPLREPVHLRSSMSCINDLWYIKKVNDPSDDEEEDLTVIRPVGNVFVDPRDF
ncbi:unnamed protein product [Ilex paraguariensis]|uniref:N-acetyltransferase domain-containing protein n=1 Tax=Ilex paraguariensis TaxID=185542 RepID=A0ABC8T164_9AQUA